MPQKNAPPKKTYYQAFYQRQNIIKAILSAFFSPIAITGRFLLEVFIRKNFGERYFNFPLVIILSVLLAVIPYTIEKMGSYGGIQWGDFLWKNITWYGYIAAFLLVCWQRKNEIKRLPSVFDFERFSLSTGIINPAFHNISIFGQKGNVRKIETLLEPALFFIIGVVLIILKQKIGLLIVVSSILYSLSYVAAYIQGDNFIMDKIDELICSEELAKTFVEGKPSDKGFNLYGRRPLNDEKRKKVYDEMVDDPDDVDFT